MTEEENLLRKAIWEIQDLRRRNEVLSAKVEVMELFGLVFRTQPNHGNNCVTEDIAWAMQKRVDEIAAMQGNARETQS